jgi:formate dehydrogenase iron-sulfur subunit
MGFFTDTTTCIGCKACEVACKQWNDLPADGYAFRRGASYDHTGRLDGTTWRHVRFVEAPAAAGEPVRTPMDAALGAGDGLDLVAMAERPGLDRWIFMSDVCKHCAHAGCLDACPTGALVRTEFGTVVLQADVCNGCGYCIPACPFGVVARVPDDGRAAKCTLCYDRLQDGLEPACAKVEVAERRVAALRERGLEGAYLYGAGADEELAGGLGAFFLLTEPPEVYGLPYRAESPVQENVVPATLAAMGAGLAAAVGAAVSFLAAHRSAGRGGARGGTGGRGGARGRLGGALGGRAGRGAAGAWRGRVRRAGGRRRRSG